MALLKRLLKPGSSPARKMDSTTTTTTSEGQIDALADQTASLSVGDDGVEVATFALS